MVHFTISFFVVVKSYSKVLVLSLGLFLYTSLFPIAWFLMNLSTNSWVNNLWSSSSSALICFGSSWSSSFSTLSFKAWSSISFIGFSCCSVSNWDSLTIYFGPFSHYHQIHYLMIFFKLWCVVSRLLHAGCGVFWVFGIPSFFNSFHESSTLLSFFPINYYKTNLHFCTPFDILLHFWFYFFSPSFFCKLDVIVCQILSCSSYFWEFTDPSVLYSVLEILSFLLFFQD